MFVFLTLPSFAVVNVSLKWDPSTDATVAGYKIYYGTTSHNYTSIVDVGNVTQATIAGLTENTTYYFAATTYDSQGNESDFSNEASYSGTSITYLPPTLNTLANLAINENSGLQTVNLSGISPGSGQSVSITAISSNPSLIPNPTVNYINPGSTGSITFAPAPNAFGSAIITVTANNGQSQSNLVSCSFTVTVNQVFLPPTLNPISNVTVNENSGTQLINLSGISLGSGQSVSITAVSSNPNLIPNPAVNYTSPNSTGSLTFTPAHNAFGTANITVTANNGQSQSNTISRTFSVTINAVNQPPTLNPINDVTLLSTAPSQSVALSGITSGAANENQTLQITAVSSNPQLVPNPTVNYTSPNTSGTLSIKGITNLTGTATITVTVNDGGASNNLSSQTFKVNVSAVYQPPTLDALNDFAIEENAGQQTVSLSGITPGTGQSVSITAASSNPTLIPNPQINYISPGSSGTLTFAPSSDAFGSAVITVTADSGQPQSNTVTRSFTVTVNQVFVAPSLNPLSDVSINENTGSQSVGLSGINSGSGQSVSIIAVSSNPNLIPNPNVIYSSPNSVGTLVFTPNTNSSGSAVITVTANNGQGKNNTISRSFTVNVAAVYGPPTMDSIENLNLGYNSKRLSITLNGVTAGTGNDNRKIKISAVSSDPSIVPNPTTSYNYRSNSGKLTVAPALYSHGTAVITVTADNQQPENNIVTRTFTICVASNLPPTLDAIEDVSLAYNSAQQKITLTGITAGAPDENQRLKITAVSSDPMLIGNPRASYNSRTGTGSLNLRPARNASGTAMITVTVDDGQPENHSVERTFKVTVAHNQPPTLDPVADVTLAYDSKPQTMSLTGISAGSPDETKQKLRVTAVSSDPAIIPNPRASFNGRTGLGTLNLRPAKNTNGVAIITVTVDDGQPESNLVTRTFSLTIAPNLPPTLDPIANMTLPYNPGAQTVNLTGIGPGSPDENQKLSVTAVSSDPTIIPNPRVQFNSRTGTGTLSIAPKTGTNGIATITVTVNDGSPENNLFSRTFLVSIAPQFTPSVAKNISLPAPAWLSQPTHADGKFSCQVIGETGKQYIVQASSDMVHWSAVCTNAAPFTFEDGDAANFPQRFYRAVLIPNQ